MKKEYFFYTKDQNFIKKDGKIIPNPVPGPLRQRRQTIRGSIVNTGKTSIMQFQRMETIYPDNFSRPYGRSEVIKKNVIATMQVPDTNDKELVKLFIEKAKTLVIPGPTLREITVPEHTEYKRVRVNKKLNAFAD